MMHLFTETYIKMMRDSPIQDEWIPTRGHYYYSPFEAETLFCIEYDYPYRGEGDFWLPLDYDWWGRIEEEWILGIEFLFTKARLCGHWGYELEVVKYYPNKTEAEHVKIFSADSILELLALYVHKEKWGLIWDEEKGWVDN